MVEQLGDPTVHIRILQPDQSLPDDSALIDDKHTGSSDGLGEYGISEKSITDHSSGDNSGEEGDRSPKSNKEIQGKAIRSSQLDV